MEHPELYRLVILLLIPGKVMGKTILETIFKHVKLKKVTGKSHNEYRQTWDSAAWSREGSGESYQCV